MNMSKKAQRKTKPPELAKGQLWRLSHAYIQIVELGRRLLEYKMLSEPDEPGVRTKMSGVETMWEYLRSRRAQLVRTEPASAKG